MPRRRKHSRISREPQQATIENLSHDGLGIARIEGKTTFIQGALPGEEVMFQYTEKKKQYDKGFCLEVLTSSPDRVEAKCAHYQACGGCSLQHMALDKQIAHKQQVLFENFTHMAKVSPINALDPLTDKAWHYRDKARLSVRFVEKKGEVLVGFRERMNGRFITNIDSCVILNEVVGLEISHLKALVGSLSNYQDIAQIEVAIGESANVLILRHLSPMTLEDLDKLSAFGEEKNLTWYLQPGGMDSIHPLDKAENLSYRLESFDLTLEFGPGDFTQINPRINEKMVQQAIKLLDLKDDDKVLDLFCGLGNFSLAMARKAGNVVGVEGSEQMVKKAQSNARLNGIENACFYAANLFEPIDKLPWFSNQFNKLLIDPPRLGAKEVCEQIERFDVDTICYVSCSPQTLARDADILVNQKGYTLHTAGVMDMFPHTSHVESMALFTR